MTVDILLIMPDGTPKEVLLMVVGDNGLSAFGNCCQEGSVTYNSNFLSVNISKFKVQGYAAFLVNAPSDQPNGMSPDFRMSSANIQTFSEYTTLKRLNAPN